MTAVLGGPLEGGGRCLPAPVVSALYTEVQRAVLGSSPVLIDPFPTRSYTPPGRAFAKNYVGSRFAGGAGPKHQEIVDCGREPG